MFWALWYSKFFSGPGGPPGSHPALVEGSVSYIGVNCIKQKLFIGVTLVLKKKIKPRWAPGVIPHPGCGFRKLFWCKFHKTKVVHRGYFGIEKFFFKPRWAIGVTPDFVKVCIFHNQKMHVYLIYFKTIVKAA